MARESYPHTLVHFRATMKNGHAYFGIIEPDSEPCTQRQYEDKYVKKTLIYYRRLDTVVRIVVTRFKIAGEITVEEFDRG